MASASGVFNVEAALDRLGGDEELLKEVGTLFLDESQELLAEIHLAIQSADPTSLERTAHTLKGSIANFGTGPAYDAALELERLGRARRLDQTTAIYRRLTDQIILLQRAVQEYCS